MANQNDQENIDNLDSEDSFNNLDPVNKSLVKFLPIIQGSFLCISPQMFFTKQREIIRFNRSDHIIIPADMAERILYSRMTQHILRLFNTNLDIQTYGRIIAYDAPHRTIVIPDWMFESLMIKPGDKVDADTVQIGKLESLKMKIPKCMTDPHAILEYELRDHSVIYTGKILITKILGKCFELVVTDTKPGFVGIINNADLNLEIEYDQN